eukprot:1768170-Rhodomonas_salina.1
MCGVRCPVLTLRMGRAVDFVDGDREVGSAGPADAMRGTDIANRDAAGAVVGTGIAYPTAGYKASRSDAAYR